MDESEIMFVEQMAEKSIFEITEEEAERIHEINKKVDLSRLSNEEIEKRNRALYTIATVIFGEGRISR